MQQFVYVNAETIWVFHYVNKQWTLQGAYKYYIQEIQGSCQISEFWESHWCQYTVLIACHKPLLRLVKNPANLVI
jgi:hypothetical protein